MKAAIRKKLKAILWRSAGIPGLTQNILRRATVVVGFHRVVDGHRSSGLDCSPALFNDLCRFFRDHFRVIPLTTLVQDMNLGRLVGGELAITFDDGYRDALTQAAPILQHYGLPATFFLTTTFVGASKTPWWDAAQGVHHPFLTWDDVAELHREGFEIGSHTRGHNDLTTLSEMQLWEEVAGSRDDISAHLGVPPDMFAYPYGGGHQINDAAIMVIQKAGFSCSCGLFGGINLPGDDPFRLKRIPISNWYLSSAHFGGDVLVTVIRELYHRRKRS
ncbi:MAG: polysaccharide deacetylase family protein [Deltaproteobacteria bacterium]|nr:polysaccharide deacetylase family protein [Deltaproteobacteria bacterium]